MSMFICAQASRPIRNARRYSTTCTTSMPFLGSSTCCSRPPLTPEAFNTRTMPPAPITCFGSLSTGTMMRNRASGSNTESASTTHMYGEVAAFSPAFMASALLPIESLSITSNRGSLTLR